MDKVAKNLMKKNLPDPLILILRGIRDRWIQRHYYREGLRRKKSIYRSGSREPLVTVITPTWKRPREVIERCIKCVDDQSFPDWEHIICSDGYEKEVEGLVAAGNNAKRIYMRLNKHGGDFGNNVRQVCLGASRGKYILFYDDDNVIYPDYLSKMVTALAASDKEVGFAVCRVITHGPVPPELGKPPLVLTGIPVRVKNVDPLQVLVKKEALVKIGGWDTARGYLADGVTLERLANSCVFVEVPEVLGVHL